MQLTVELQIKVGFLNNAKAFVGKVLRHREEEEHGLTNHP